METHAQDKPKARSATPSRGEVLVIPFTAEDRRRSKILNEPSTDSLRSRSRASTPAPEETLSYQNIYTNESKKNVRMDTFSAETHPDNVLRDRQIDFVQYLEKSGASLVGRGDAVVVPYTYEDRERNKLLNQQVRSPSSRDIRSSLGTLEDIKRDKSRSRAGTPAKVDILLVPSPKQGPEPSTATTADIRPRERFSSPTKIIISMNEEPKAVEKPRSSSPRGEMLVIPITSSSEVVKRNKPLNIDIRSQSRGRPSTDENKSTPQPSNTTHRSKSTGSMLKSNHPVQNASKARSPQTTKNPSTLRSRPSFRIQSTNRSVNSPSNQEKDLAVDDKLANKTIPKRHKDQSVDDTNADESNTDTHNRQGDAHPNTSNDARKEGVIVIPMTENDNHMKRMKPLNIDLRSQSRGRQQRDQSMEQAEVKPMELLKRPLNARAKSPMIRERFVNQLPTQKQESHGSSNHNEAKGRVNHKVPPSHHDPSNPKPGPSHNNVGNNQQRAGSSAPSQSIENKRSQAYSNGARNPRVNKGLGDNSSISKNPPTIVKTERKSLNIDARIQARVKAAAASKPAESIPLVRVNKTFLERSRYSSPSKASKKGKSNKPQVPFVDKFPSNRPAARPLGRPPPSRPSQGTRRNGTTATPSARSPVPVASVNRSISQAKPINNPRQSSGQVASIAHQQDLKTGRWSRPSSPISKVKPSIKPSDRTSRSPSPRPGVENQDDLLGVLPEMMMQETTPSDEPPHTPEIKLSKNMSNKSSYFVDNSSMDNKVVSITKTVDVIQKGHMKAKRTVYRIVTPKPTVQEIRSPNGRNRSGSRASDSIKLIKSPVRIPGNNR